MFERFVINSSISSVRSKRYKLISKRCPRILVPKDDQKWQIRLLSRHFFKSSAGSVLAPTKTAFFMNHAINFLSLRLSFRFRTTKIATSTDWLTKYLTMQNVDCLRMTMLAFSYGGFSKQNSLKFATRLHLESFFWAIPLDHDAQLDFQNLFTFIVKKWLNIQIESFFGLFIRFVVLGSILAKILL
jgi:hypothetical protein